MKSICFLFIVFFYQGLSQNISLKVDSIKVYYVGWTTVFRLEMEDYNIRNLQTNNSPASRKLKIIKDTSIILDFCKILLYDNKLSIPDNNIFDVRMVIDIYAQGNILTVSLNKRLEYVFPKRRFMRNDELVNWINKYVTSTE